MYGDLNIPSAAACRVLTTWPTFHVSYGYAHPPRLITASLSRAAWSERSPSNQKRAEISYHVMFSVVIGGWMPPCLFIFCIYALICPFLCSEESSCRRMYQLNSFVGENDAPLCSRLHKNLFKRGFKPSVRHKPATSNNSISSIHLFQGIINLSRQACGLLVPFPNVSPSPSVFVHAWGRYW